MSIQVSEDTWLGTFLKRVSWWVLSTIGLISVTSGCNCRPDTRITDQDFWNDQQRVDFLEDYVPFEIPSGAHDVQFVFVSWLDWTLKLSFVLSKGDYEVLRDRVTKQPMNNNGGFLVRDEKKGAEAVVRLVSEKRMVLVEANNIGPPESSGGSMDPIPQGENVLDERARSDQNGLVSTPQ